MLLSSSRNVIRVVLPWTDVLFGLGRRLLSSMMAQSEPWSRDTVVRPEHSWSEVKLDFSSKSNQDYPSTEMWLLVRIIKHCNTQIKFDTTRKQQTEP